MRSKIKVLANVDIGKLELEVNNFLSLHKIESVESIQYQTVTLPEEYVNPVEYSVLIVYKLKG